MKQSFIAIFLLLCVCQTSLAYTPKGIYHYFKTMDIRDGLSQNTVYQILQDRKGFMWFGTKDGETSSICLLMEGNWTYWIFGILHPVSGSVPRVVIRSIKAYCIII